jgi:UDP-N-acetylmuramoyl-tripeptide--D-alanyl-D-alanine ligase
MMSALTLPAIAAKVGAAYTGSALPVAGLAIDSRRVERGDLFVAVSGERVDGHDYVAAAAERGAVAALTERPLEAPIPCLVVADCLAALAQIGQVNRDLYAGELIAITGSCGKTSVKNMCRSIFNIAGATIATAGNYNNEIGVPLTLARLDDATRYAVVEMGATRRGDIAHLCQLARPSVSTVLNAMEAHLEGFGSVADVADVKAEIFDGLGSGGWGILNLDQSWAPLWRQRINAAGARIISYSLATAADVSASALCDRGLAGTVFTLSVAGESREVNLPLPGRHSVANALAAAALASAAGVRIDAIATGLERSEAESGRLQPETLHDGTVLIDDSYNANPGSVRAAIELLARSRGRTALILGEMLELGSESAARHAEMGELARKRGVGRLVGVGDALKVSVEAFGDGGSWYPSRDALVSALPELLDSCDTILVKGSRGAAMEAVLVALRDVATGGDAC